MKEEEKMTNEPQKLTKNEKRIIKLLLDNARISDSDMAEKLKITSQAVGKIRKRLEERCIIKRYTCELNCKKMGLNVFAVVMLKHKNGFWEKFDGHICDMMRKNIPETIFSCFTYRSDITFIALHAFRNIDELDEYFEIVRQKFHKYVEIINIYPFSNHNLLKFDSSELFKLIIDDKKIVPPSSFI